MYMLRPWCHPYCLSISAERDATHWRRPGLLLCSKGRKTTFCWLLYCVGTIHLFLLASVKLRFCLLAAGFLRSAAHEGVLRRVFPFRTSTLLRIAVGAHSRTFFVQRGSVY